MPVAAGLGEAMGGLRGAHVPLACSLPGAGGERCNVASVGWV